MRGDTVFPIAPHFAAEQISRTRFKLDPGASETGGRALAEAHGRWRAKGDADHLVELRTVTVPADAGAGVVADDQGMREILGRQLGEIGSPLAEGQQPFRNRLAAGEAGMVEIVPPPKASGQPLAGP